MRFYDDDPNGKLDRFEFATLVRDLERDLERDLDGRPCMQVLTTAPAPLYSQVRHLEGGIVRREGRAAKQTEAEADLGMAPVAHESAKRNPLNHWSVDKVEDWLKDIDPKIARAAKAAGVNGRVLQELDAPAWTELGVTVALRRCQLVAAVKEATEGRDATTIPFEDTAPSRAPSSSSRSHLTPEEEEELRRLEAWKKGLDEGDKMAAEAAKKADKEAAEAKKEAQKEAKKKADMEAAKAEAKQPSAKKKAEKEAAVIAARIADLRRHRIHLRCAIQNLNAHDSAKSQTFEALIKFEASWEDRSPILYEMLAAGYKLDDRIVKEKCTYNKLVILQHDGSENSELFTPRITFKNLAREPTTEELYVVELPLMTTDGLPDDR